MLKGQLSNPRVLVAVDLCKHSPRAALLHHFAERLVLEKVWQAHLQG